MLNNKVPLLDVKVGGWCAMTATQIIGPTLFSETIKFIWICYTCSDLYLFQHDSSTVQITKISTCYLGSILGDRITRKGLWLPCLTNATHVVFRHVKG
jgi:hypothetical protein